MICFQNSLLSYFLKINNLNAISIPLLSIKTLSLSLSLSLHNNILKYNPYQKTICNGTTKQNFYAQAPQLLHKPPKISTYSYLIIKSILNS